MEDAVQRFQSVDALRGLTVMAMLFVNDPGDWQHVLAPFRHAEWHGATPTDVIFPTFLFIVGVSISLALVPKRAAGVPMAELRRSILLRALRLFALGLLLNALGYIVFELQAYRVMGVLQRIALCYAAGAFIALYCSPRVQWILIAGLLLGYWGLLVAGGPLTPDGNLASRIDTAILHRHVFEYDAATGHGRDPEGLLTTLTALVNTLLGLHAGRWLRCGEARRMWLAGAICLVVGFAWSFLFPFNKNLWTSSFVVWTAGWGFVLLAIFHVLVDRRGWPPLGRTYGVNAVAMFAGSMLLVYILIGLGLLQPLYQDGIATWLTPLAGPYASSHAFALLFVLFWWFVAWRLDRREIYLKI